MIRATSRVAPHVIAVSIILQCDLMTTGIAHRPKPPRLLLIDLLVISVHYSVATDTTCALQFVVICATQCNQCLLDVTLREGKRLRPHKHQKPDN